MFKFLIKTGFLGLFFFLSYTTVQAQIDIKSKVDADTYANYSKAIDLFEKNINPNDVVTLFLPINYSFNRLSQDKQIAILNNNSVEINLFIRNHCSSILVDLNYFNSNLNIDINQNIIELLNNNKIFYQKNGNKILLGNSANPLFVTYESHINKSINLSSHILLNFLDGIFLY